MSTRPRPRPQIHLDRAEIAKLMRRGWTPQRIADQFGMTVHQVSADWSVIIREIRETRDEDAMVHIAIKLEEYSEIKKEAWAAWELSKEYRRKVMIEQYGDSKAKKGKKPPRGKVTRSRENRLPGSEYLRIIMDCVRDERKLLGLDATTSIQMSGSVSWDSFVTEVNNDTQDVIENKLAQLTHAPVGNVVSLPSDAIEILESFSEEGKS